MTSFLPSARARFGFDVEHLRAQNPDLIYVRGSSVGIEGDEVDKPGFDFTVFWARSGFQSAATGGSGLHQPVSPRPGFGDKTAAVSIAFGIAAALYRRERTGEPAEIDVSLLGAALWSNSSDVAYSRAAGRDTAAQPMARRPPSGAFETADGRFLLFNVPDVDRVWVDLCRCLGRHDLEGDPRFAGREARESNARELVAELDRTFADATLEEWRRRLAPLRVAWEVVQNPYEVADDPQVVANGYVAQVRHPNGETLELVRPPVQFDRGRPALGRAPAVAEHTEEILAEIGYDEAAVARCRAAGAIP